MLQRRDALRTLSYGVYVVSARNGDEINALTMRMVSQVSSRPPCLGLSIAKVRYTHDLILASKAFVVNVLAQGQEMIGGHFGLRSGRDQNKFAGIDYSTGETGGPILNDCCAYLECRLVAAHDMNTCTLFIGEVVAARSHHRKPLVYKHDDYFC